MYILGISCYYHDASAALIKDGQVVAAAEEERFTRKKHDFSFPVMAINYCLESQKIKINDVAFVGFYEKPFLKFERVLSQHLEMFPWSFKTFLSSMPSWINEKLRLPKTLKKKIGWNGGVLFIEHHLAHAASSFLTSPFEDSAIITVDGVGEWTTTAYGVGIGNNINLEKEIKFPSSIGLLYSTITAYLGFSVNNSEYKLMGLSSYGKMDREQNVYYKKLKQVVDIKEDGSFRFDMSYFKFHWSSRMPAKKLCDLLGGPVRKSEKEEITERQQDIAAAVQLITEDIIIKILNHVQKVSKNDKVVLAGGAALNSVCNGKILKNTNFKSIWIQPNASDGGASIGVALYIYHTLLNNPRTKQTGNIYLGPEFSNQDIELFLNNEQIKYSRFENSEEMINKTAELIKNNYVVGWFQKGMEWGPRALGARSILASPINPLVKELLNTKVKHREKFRPFAPVVCADDAMKYFECDQPLPEPTDYMLMVYPVKKEWQDKIPSVTHVDGSGRLQTIRREQNELYYDLVKKFGELTGVPILVNTSFNIRGEPIVCTPAEAYKCMMGTGIDYLVMGNYLIKREDNPQDMWDSEQLATD